MKSLPSLFVVVTACSSTTTPPPPPAPPTVVVSPAASDVLTCSTAQFTATVTDAVDPTVAWAASPGMIDATGRYTSPLATPSPASATITASLVSDPSVADSAAVSLATAFPGAPVTIPSAPGSSGALGTTGVYQHAIAAHGARTYAVYQDNPANSTTVALRVARSDDSGATWTQPTAAFTAALTDGMDTSQAWVECPAIAVDAANPDVIYATARISGSNSIGAEVGVAHDPVLVLAVSTDGGATFSHHVIHGGTPVGYCADVVSPAADTVVIDDPVDQCGKDIWVWSDTHRGASFATGTSDGGNYVADQATTGLDEVDGRTCSDAAKVNLESNGTVSAGGEATETPRMVTDGAGRVCISYIGDTTAVSPTPIHAYVQCSTDLGKTFSPAITLDPGVAGNIVHSDANGALGPDHAVAVAWVRALDPSDLTAHLFVATSANDGATFAGAVRVPTYVLPGTSTGAAVVNPTVRYDANGILWLAYRVDDGGMSDRIVVDKSCDRGVTWSGAVLVNGTEQQIVDAQFTDMKWPVLIGGANAAPELAASAGDHASVFRLAP